MVKQKPTSTVATQRVASAMTWNIKVRGERREQVDAHNGSVEKDISWALVYLP